MDLTHSTLYSRFDHSPRPIIEFLIWLTSQYGLPPAPHVLDVGCGVGRLLSAYDRTGWTAIGIEPDADFYTLAAEVARQSSCLKVMRGGFLDIDSESAFDLVTAINDPLNYVLDFNQRVEALRRVYRALRPCGVFFLEMTNFVYKLRHYAPMTEETDEIDGVQVKHIMQHEIDFHNALWIHHDEYVLDGEPSLIHKIHRLAIITLPEILRLLEQTGFKEIKTFNSYDAKESEPVTGKSMLIAAQKTKEDNTA